MKQNLIVKERFNSMRNLSLAGLFLITVWACNNASDSSNAKKDSANKLDSGIKKTDSSFRNDGPPVSTPPNQ